MAISRSLVMDLLRSEYPVLFEEVSRFDSAEKEFKRLLIGNCHSLRRYGEPTTATEKAAIRKTANMILDNNPYLKEQNYLALEQERSRYRLAPYSKTYGYESPEDRINAMKAMYDDMTHRMRMEADARTYRDMAMMEPHKINQFLNGDFADLVRYGSATRTMGMDVAKPAPMPPKEKTFYDKLREDVDNWLKDALTLTHIQGIKLL